MSSQTAAPTTTWLPTPSSGGWIGVGLCAAWGLSLGALAVAFATGPTPTSRFVAFALAVVVVAALWVSVMGVWAWFTLRYVLGPNALEIRSSLQRLRIRYDQITVADEPYNAPPTDVATLWPGAHLGCQPGPGERPIVWRATNRDPSMFVTVAGADRDCIVTPLSAGPFRDALLFRVRGTLIRAAPASIRCTWLDELAARDGWVRTLIALSLVVATLAVTADTVQGAAVGRDMAIATMVLIANAFLALALSTRATGAARLLAAASLAVEVIAMLG